MPAIRQCQILTNLANQLNKIGRFIDAIEIYDRVLSRDCRFGMARGNRGIALSHYAGALYDRGHTAVMLAAAYDSIEAAVARDAFYEGVGYAPAQEAFHEESRRIESHMDVDAHRKATAKKYKLGKSTEERRYRKWCLQNRLFINPLNDLGILSIASQDILMLPSLTVNASMGGAMLEIIGFFNQIKQEFVSARYLYYEGVHAKAVHFADHDVLLYNTLDYPTYSLGVERVRAAFRLAYSLLDKISFFLNHYLQLGHRPKV